MGRELPFSLKDFVFKTQGLKNSKSFLAVPPLPPHATAAPLFSYDQIETYL